jgi:hypothetical protein
MSAAELQQVPLIWRAAPPRWGHPLHSICSYLAMFPPRLASTIIRWLSEPSDVVYDPFAGRGTTPLEAFLQGRQGYGADANPLAHALTAAKVKVPARSQVRKRLMVLEEDYDGARIDVSCVPAEIAMLYSPKTLRQLEWLRTQLRPHSRVDQFIQGIALGMLHANHSAHGATRGFSISMPNTFAMAPNYVREYIEDKGLTAPDVNVFRMLRFKAQSCELPESAQGSGRSWLHDATHSPPPTVRKRRPQLILTSPPYLQVIKYGKYNWVRLWFLGCEAREVDAALTATSSLERYRAFMASVLDPLKQVLADDGYLCLVVGDVRRGDKQLNLAAAIRDIAEPRGWHCHGIIVDALPTDAKVSRIWKENPGRATKTDRLLLLSPTDVALPPLPTIDWAETPSLQPSKEAQWPALRRN